MTSDALWYWTGKGIHISDRSVCSLVGFPCSFMNGTAICSTELWKIKTKVVNTIFSMVCVLCIWIMKYKIIGQCNYEWHTYNIHVHKAGHRSTLRSSVFAFWHRARKRKRSNVRSTCGRLNMDVNTPASKRSQLIGNTAIVRKRCVIHTNSTCVCWRLSVATFTQKRKDASFDLWPP